MKSYFLLLTVFFGLNMAPIADAAFSPALSETGTIESGEWHYFEVTVPDDLEGWRMVASSENGEPELYLKEGEQPATSNADFEGADWSAGANAYTSTIAVDAADLSAGTWHIGVHNSGGSALNFSLNAEETPAVGALAWDDGDGSGEYSVSGGAAGGLHHFTITTRDSALGAWRQALNVASGQAQLLLREGNPATFSNNDYDSGLTDTGGGHVRELGTSGVSARTWHLTVAAESGSDWTLVAGDVPVTDLGELAEADGSGIASEIPVEGVRFFKATVPQEARAWHVWLKPEDGSAETLDWQFDMRTNAVPAPGSNGDWDGFGADHDLRSSGQALFAPGEIDPGGGDNYFLAVQGTPGESFHLVSRRQPVTDVAFDDTTDDIHGDDGARFHTFRVSVPDDIIGWEVTSLREAGSPFIAARRDEVPNARFNNAFSEVGGAVDNSFTLVPPDLDDGTYFVTVYGNDAIRFRLRNGAPEVTLIDYESLTTNDDPDRAGWRYFQMPESEAQILGLGWLMELENEAFGTRIAIRRNDLPGSWKYRDGGSEQTRNHAEGEGENGFLQQPEHESDFWYIGIYTGGAALGEFSLDSGSLAAPALSLESEGNNILGLRPGEWAFYRFDIPADGKWDEADILGWELRSTRGSNPARPTMVLRRTHPPSQVSSDLGYGRFTDWSTGGQVTSTRDWTGRSQSASGDFQEESVIAFGMGQPLVPGTYYLGFRNTSPNQFADVTWSSRLIGAEGSGFHYETKTLPPDGGEDSGSLAPRAVAYYAVDIPEETPSWRLTLDLPGGNEGRLYVRKDHLPNILVNNNESWEGFYNPLDSSFPVRGRQALIQSDEGESFDVWPPSNADFVEPGRYYVMVVSEGQIPANNNQIGTGPINYTLTSQTNIPVENLGLITEGEERELTGQSYAPGGINYYRFEVPEDMPGVRIRLANVTGDPYLRMRQDDVPPGLYRLSSGGGSNNLYGHYNPRRYEWWHAEWIYLTNPEPGAYHLSIGARLANQLAGGGYTLIFEGIEAEQADIDGFTATITGQPQEEWRFYAVDVPDDVLGWDIRVSGWEGNRAPTTAIRPQLLPTATTNDGWSFNVTPGDATSWISSRTIARDSGEWAGRPAAADGGQNNAFYQFTFPFGQPLAAETYYLGFYVSPFASEPLDITWTSRAIGEVGSGYSHEVEPIAFQDGSAAGTLEAREMAFYKVEIPEGTHSSWHVELDLPDAGEGDEAQLYIRKDFLPNTEANSSATSNPANPLADNGRQTRLDKEGGERFVLWPERDEETIAGGTYYLMVVSEGRDPEDSRIGTGSVSYELISHGEAEINDLGTMPVAGEIEEPGAYQPGEVNYHHVEVPEGVLSLEFRLEDVEGSPVMHLLEGDLPSTLSTGYGHYSGRPTPSAQRSSELITFPDPAPGMYTIAVAASPNDDDLYEEGEYTLRVTSIGAVDISMDGYTDTVNGLGAGEWVYYLVEVPESIGGETVLGWEVRVEEWTGSAPPLMAISRDEIPPNAPNPSFGLSTSASATRWDSGDWAATRGTNWTRRDYSADGTVEHEQSLMTIPMGQQLAAGTYYVAFRNDPGNDPLDFTWTSKAIGGAGSGLSYETTPIPFDGGSAGGNLDPRRIAYYTVDVPEETASWEFHLDVEAGHEALLYVRGKYLPNSRIQSSDTQNLNDWDPESAGAPMLRLDKPGGERFTLWPERDEAYIQPGRYYLMVVSAGQEPTADDRVGTGAATYTLRSEGQAHVNDLGTITPGDTVLEADQSYEAGEIHYYQFDLPAGIDALEVRLLNRAGSPAANLATGGVPPRAFDFRPSFSSGVYGQFSGYLTLRRSQNSFNLGNPDAGTYSLAIAHSEHNPAYGTGGYDLRIRAVEPASLQFGSPGNHASGSLAEDQRDYYQVTVTEMAAPPSEGEPVPEEVLGWRLQLSESSGQAEMRVRLNAVPEDFGSGQHDWQQGSMLIVPPFLEPGDWYVEVRGATATDYTLSSRPILLSSMHREVWEMPAMGESSDAPGLDGAVFGDTGIDAGGTPLPGDQGTDLSNGDYHLYAINIPGNNGGLLRTVLETLSGDPQLYLRPGALPTTSHNENGWNGRVADHWMNDSAQTERGNWVPYSVMENSRLEAGLWFLKVHADGDTSARYRLILSHNTDPLVQDLAADGGSFDTQALNADDWRYYKVEFPGDPVDTPEEWKLTFTENSGEVTMYLREHAPPGLWEDTDVNDRLTYDNPRDWSNGGSWNSSRHDHRRFEEAGTYTLTGDQLQLGATYYIGFRANSDAVFSVESETGSETIESRFGSITDLSGTGGIIDLDLAPDEIRTWKVSFPAEAEEWRSFAQHEDSVEIHVGQHSLLPFLAGDGSNFLESGGAADWSDDRRFFSGYRDNENTFYMTVHNTSDETQPFWFFVDWREEEHFALDLSTDGEGSVTVTPEEYTSADTVTLEAIPDLGWSFTGWSGDVDSTENPLELTPYAELSIIANFEAIVGAYISDAELLTEQQAIGEGPGHPIEIEVTVSNTSGATESVTPTLNFDNGEETWSVNLDPIEIDADQTETHVLEYDLADVNPDEESATYVVDVNRADAGSFLGIYVRPNSISSEYEAGDTLFVSARAYRHPDSAIDFEITLEIDGTQVISEEVSLSAGSGSSFHNLEWPISETGEKTITVNAIAVEGSPITVIDPDSVVGTVELQSAGADSPHEVGDAVSINYSVREIGGDYDGAIDLVFSIDGRQEQARTVEVGAGETINGSFTHTFDSPGTYEVSVNDETFEIVIEAPEVSVEFTNLTVSSTAIYTGQFVSVTADLENLDAFAGVYEVDFLVADAEGSALLGFPVWHTVQLGANEKVTVTFHHLFENEGDFQVAICELDPVDVSVTSAWPQSGRSHGNVTSAFDAPQPYNLETLWSYEAGDQDFHYVRSAPAIVDGVAYVGSYPAAVHAIDIETGNLIWNQPFEADSAIVTDPAVADGRVFATTGGAGGTSLHAVDAETGAELWTNAGLGDAKLTSPIVVDDTVFVGSDNGTLHAFNTSDGSERWHHDAAAAIHSTPAYAHGILFFGTDANVQAIDAVTGEPAWSTPYPASGVRSAAVVTELFSTGEWVVFVAEFSGKVHAVRAFTTEDDPGGEAYWSEPFDAGEGIDAAPAIGGEQLFVVTSEGTIHQLDALTGEADEWNAPFQADGGIVGTPAFANSRIHFATTEGTVNAVPYFVPDPQVLWSHDLGAAIRSSVVIQDGVLYVGADDAHLHAVHSLGEGGGPDPDPEEEVPQIVTHPASQTVNEGESVTFTVEATGDGPLEYMWGRIDDEDPLTEDFSGGPSFTIDSVTPADAGEYVVIVKYADVTDPNEDNVAISEFATLQVIPAAQPNPPSITQEPASVAVVEGESAAFTVAATGDGPLSYQWSKDGETIAGATASSLEIANATLADAGEYKVVVSNAHGSVSSGSVTLTVWQLPRIDSKPVDQTVVAGESVTFDVSASGDGTLTYRWSHNGSVVSDFSESSSFTLPSALTADAGDYTVEVQTEHGEVTSGPATLTVTVPEGVPLSLEGATETDNPNTYESDWFGIFYAEEDLDGWLFSEAHGWIYVWEEQPGGTMWFWHLALLETVYTSADYYPAVYSQVHGWLYYVPDAGDPSIAWFYIYETEEWFSVGG